MAPLVDAAGAARRWRPYAAVAAAGVILGALVASTDPLQRVEWSVYDLFARRLARHADPPSNIVVVALDEPSIAEIGLPWPWPRSLHATLIDRLVEAGARTIAFDVLFDTPGADPDDDHELADAIRRAGNVVLAADRSDVGDRHYSVLQWFDPLPSLAEGAVRVGVVRIPYDPDGVLRRAALTIEGRPSFALAVASGDSRFQAPPDIDTPKLFRFNGEPRRGIVTVSYYQALDAAQSLPPGIFKNAHVLVGRSLQAATLESQAVGSSRVDLQACKLEYSIVSPK